VINKQGRNEHTANLLKTIYFECPDWTPCHVELLPATWIRYREELEALVLRHPWLFPGYEEGSRKFDRIDNPLQEVGERTDCWGVTWRNNRRGLDGVPVRHPLEDWSTLNDYQRPDAIADDLFGPRDWAAVERSYAESKQRGNLATALELPHGFLFLRLAYLRGFENLMWDFAHQDPRLFQLIPMVEDYAIAVVTECLRRDAEYVWLGDDFGMHDRLMVSPTIWRELLLPSYERILARCTEVSVPVQFHSDGRILDILPDLIGLGVGVVHLQYTANGLEGLQHSAQGRVALNVDLDRQLFPLAPGSVIEDHIREVHQGLWLKEGGTMLHAECGPDVQLGTIEAICAILERVCRPS
jgi:hypothetical protein